jgi:glutamate racemase
MKIGLFDSGLGGLLITQAISARLPEHEYLYLGDTARVPYGNRSQATVLEFTTEAVTYLFGQGCDLIIIACNTASAEALRSLQQRWLPKHYPDRRILGVLVPAAEAAAAATKSKKVGVLATRGTVTSGTFDRELKVLDPAIEVVSSAAPLLVPLVEYDGLEWAEPILERYLAPLHDVDTLILGCTHYPYLKAVIRDMVGKDVEVISQDEVVPDKLADYISRHPELGGPSTQPAQRRYLVTDQTDDAVRIARELAGQPIALELVTL